MKRLRPYVPKNPFWSVVLLRLVVPMDVISYVLGLFTDIGWLKYAAATAIGLTPSAFLLAYLGKLPNAYEISAVGAGVILVAMSVLTARRKGRIARHG